MNFFWGRGKGGRAIFDGGEGKERKSPLVRKREGEGEELVCSAVHMCTNILVIDTHISSLVDREVT